MTEISAESTAQGKASATRRMLTLTLPQLWALVSLVSIFVLLNLTRVHPDGFWWHIRAKQWTLENGRVPIVDPFGYEQARRAGLWDPSELVREIEAKRFPMILLVNPESVLQQQGWATPGHGGHRGELRWHRRDAGADRL